MLNYLGATPAPGLSMPSGMPGSGAPSDPMASPGAASALGGPPSPVPPAPSPFGGGGGGGMSGFPPIGMTDPAGRQYEAVTQDDGSVLLHMKNPDGSRGPAVKIIPPIKARKGA
jgi:hypothetical protein